MMNRAFYKYYTNFFARHQRLEDIKNIFANHFYNVIAKLYQKNKYRDYSSDCIPVLINNFNRFNTLKVLVEWLLSSKINLFIIILDNNSTYPPLLEYYSSIDNEKIQVNKLGYNWGTRMLLPFAKSLYKFDYYVITDADLLPCSDSPDLLLAEMKNVLASNPGYNHVGVSLRIDDLPDHYPLKEKVVAWESQYWRNKIEDHYIADVATTFALYSRKSNPRLRKPAIRLKKPFTFKHVDWYEDPNNLTEEYKYYVRHCSTKSASWVNELRQLDGVNESLGINKSKIKIYKSYYH